MNQELFLLALVIWREARGELLSTKQGVAWSIRNRVQKPGWWGHSWWSVILMPWQYSSFNHNDPNAVKWPTEDDASWVDSITAATQVYSEQIPDPTRGAVNYFDMSLDTNPPKWATDGSMIHTVDLGRLHFYARA